MNNIEHTECVDALLRMYTHLLTVVYTENQEHITLSDNDTLNIPDANDITTTNTFKKSTRKGNKTRK